MNGQEQQLQLSNAFLNRCASVVEFHKQVEAKKLPKEWAGQIDARRINTWKKQIRRLADEIKLIRLETRENRNRFAERIGVDPLDLFVVENAAATPTLLLEVVRRIDQTQHSQLGQKVEKLLKIKKPHPHTNGQGQRFN